jgi:hypothetical protein
VSYFRSGWAFLIPYLATYLLYAWLKWPVNPVAAGSSPVDGGQLAVSAIGAIPSTIPPSTVTPSTAYSLLSTGVPCLLHVYWFLHALHLVLGALALRAWWKESSATEAGAADDSENTANRATPSQPSTVNRSPSTVPLRGHRPPSAMDRLWAAMPWLLLALLFYIPGVYLEWPSDPWEHLRRINEWRVLDTVTAHSSWLKSSYFIPYSLLSWATGLRQIFWLDFYYTGICLLLCWQYYRLARACGLGERASMVFVILQALLFGNNIFSFYRYYGISSSMYAQLGAVALTRLAIEAASHPRLALCSFFSLPAAAAALTPADPAPSIYRLLPPATLLLALTAFNHIQGIGLAGLGIGVAIAWRLIEWRRAALLWLSVAVVLLSIATVLWWPRHPSVDAVYRTQGWLTAWYGFDFSWSSLAGDRAMHIFGAFGLANLVAGIILLRQNHVAGWLTVGPVVMLMLPCVALPIATRLAAASTSEILTFHRMFFAIPGGLALACCLSRWTAKLAVPSSDAVGRLLALGAVVLLAASLVGLAPARPAYNRLWNLVSAPPQDLQLGPLITLAESSAANLRSVGNYRLVGPDAVAYILNATYPRLFPIRERIIGQPVAESLHLATTIIGSSQPTTGSKNLTRDPLATDRSAWVAVSGQAPEFIRGITGFRASTTALQNPAGQPSEVFTSELIAVDLAKNYYLEFSVHQATDTQATAYLAVAWYGERERLLNSHAPQPDGAGDPYGWANGVYSYFGLVGMAAPQKWTTYRTSFGPREAAAIPANAKFIRVGALLNYNVAPHSTIELTNVRLWEKTSPALLANGEFPQDIRYFAIIPPRRFLVTPLSQAGQSSGHWPAQQLAVALAGSRELETATHSTSAATADSGGMIFELGAATAPR